MVGGRLIRRVAIRAARRTAVRAIRCVARRELRPTAVRPVAIRVGLALLIDVSLIAGAVGTVVSVAAGLATMARVLTWWASRARPIAMVALIALAPVTTRLAVITVRVAVRCVAGRWIRPAGLTALRQRIRVMGVDHVRKAWSHECIIRRRAITRWVNGAPLASGLVVSLSLSRVESNQVLSALSRQW